ncbi:ribonuclease 3 [Trichonephila clavipes]|nr:ribonuclease 3 [Trichonephila clavipes]
MYHNAPPYHASWNAGPGSGPRPHWSAPMMPSGPMMPGNGPSPPNNGPSGVPPPIYPNSMTSPAGPSGLPFAGPGMPPPPTYPLPPPVLQPPLPVMLPSAVSGKSPVAALAQWSSTASRSAGNSDITSQDAIHNKNTQGSSKYYKSRRENIDSNLKLKNNSFGDSDFKSKDQRENIKSDKFKTSDRKKGQYTSSTQKSSRKTSESLSSIRKSCSDFKGSSGDEDYYYRKYGKRPSKRQSRESPDRSSRFSHVSRHNSHSYRKNSRSRSSDRFESHKKNDSHAKKIRSSSRRSSEEKNFERNTRYKRRLSKSPSVRTPSGNSKTGKNYHDNSKLEENIASEKAAKGVSVLDGSKSSKGIQRNNSSELKNTEISSKIDENEKEGSLSKQISSLNEPSFADLHEGKDESDDEIAKSKPKKTLVKIGNKKKLSRSRSRSISPFETERRERSRSLNRSNSGGQNHSRFRSHSKERSPYRNNSRKQKRLAVSKNQNYKRSREPNFPPRHPRSREREDTPENQPSLSTEACEWVKSTPAEKYYIKSEECSKKVLGTDALKDLHKRFKFELVDRAARVRAGKPKYEPPVRKTKLRNHKPKELRSDDDSLSSSEKSSSSEEEDTSLEELEKKRKHPDRLHPELWFNDPKEMNDGPLCRCSAKARRSGIRHGIYVGEDHLPHCEQYSNNATRLYHYKIAMTPVTNFLTKSPTIIMHEGEKYAFEGFSMFAHKPLPRLPNCKVIRFNYEYTILYVEEQMPINFTVAGLELFSDFLLHEILELVDLDWKAHNDPDGCPQFHFMPRFAKINKEDTKEGKVILSLNVVLEYLLKANSILIDEKNLSEVLAYSNKKWQDLADEVKGMIVTCPGMKPSSIRVDQLDREHIGSNSETTFPVIVHFGVRPPQLSYAGNPQYQKAWRDYVKYRHLLANKPKVRYADRHKLMQKETRLQEMRMEK